jgi:hypothetical protein
MPIGGLGRTPPTPGTAARMRLFREERLSCARRAAVEATSPLSRLSKSDHERKQAPRPEINIELNPLYLEVLDAIERPASFDNLDLESIKVLGVNDMLQEKLNELCLKIAPDQLKMLLTGLSPDQRREAVIFLGSSEANLASNDPKMQICMTFGGLR